MNKILVQLGKVGDVLNAIQIAYAEHLKGNKVGIMVCDEFAGVLDGISYATKIPFSGRPWEIPEAVEMANELCDSVTVTQTNAPVEVIRKYAYEPAGQKNAVTDSFVREAWKLAGCLSDWSRTPLVFDKRDKEREKLLMPKGWFGAGKKKKLMLVSSGSVSSPFPYRDLLMKLLTLQYPNFNIVDLSTIKAERFYDLLGLYEAAHCLVTVDTAHLHLAHAVPTLPVMALIQDRHLGRESYWHGSAWRPQHHFFCRYQDFPRRAMELFTAIENIGTQPLSNILQVYHGSVRTNNSVRYFPIQYGSCKRDAVNVLGDKEHFPMLQDVIRMTMQVAKPNDYIVLTREDTKLDFEFAGDLPKGVQSHPCYAYRMNRDKDGNDTYFPAVDLFAAPVDFWVKIFPEIPDVVMDNAPVWARILLEIFKANGAIEVNGIYRNE